MVRSSRRCRHPQHEPGPRALPGLYWHRCPACGLRTTFTVPPAPVAARPLAVAIVAALLALGAVLLGAGCGRGPLCAPRPAATDSGPPRGAPATTCEVRR